jgi:hypothetical protein
MTIPIGTLMKNHTRQDSEVVRIPPRTRPRLAPIPATAP